MLSAAVVLASGLTRCDTLWCLGLVVRQVPGACATALAWWVMNEVSLLLAAAGELDPAGPVCAPEDVDGFGDPLGETVGVGVGGGGVVGDDEGDGGLVDGGELGAFVDGIAQGVELGLGPELAGPTEGEPVPSDRAVPFDRLPGELL